MHTVSAADHAVEPLLGVQCNGPLDLILRGRRDEPSAFFVLNEGRAELVEESADGIRVDESVVMIVMRAAAATEHAQ